MAVFGRHVYAYVHEPWAKERKYLMLPGQVQILCITSREASHCMSAMCCSGISTAWQYAFTLYQHSTPQKQAIKVDLLAFLIGNQLAPSACNPWGRTWKTRHRSLRWVSSRQLQRVRLGITGCVQLAEVLYAASS